MFEENQYLGLIREILDDGTITSSRNGETKAIFGHMSKYNLKLIKI